MDRPLTWPLSRERKVETHVALIFPGSTSKKVKTRGFLVFLREGVGKKNIRPEWMISVCNVSFFALFLSFEGDDGIPHVVQGQKAKVTDNVEQLLGIYVYVDESTSSWARLTYMEEKHSCALATGQYGNKLTFNLPIPFFFTISSVPLASVGHFSSFFVSFFEDKLVENTWRCWGEGDVPLKCGRKKAL